MPNAGNNTTYASIQVSLAHHIEVLFDNGFFETHELSWAVAKPIAVTLSQFQYTVELTFLKEGYLQIIQHEACAWRSLCGLLLLPFFMMSWFLHILNSLTCGVTTPIRQNANHDVKLQQRREFSHLSVLFINIYTRQ